MLTEATNSTIYFESEIFRKMGVSHETDHTAVREMASARLSSNGSALRQQQAVLAGCLRVSRRASRDLLPCRQRPSAIKMTGAIG